MSYNVHLTRAELWTESMNNPISLEEAKSCFDQRDDFEYTNMLSLKGPFGTMSLEGDFFHWSVEDFSVPFSYKEGRITVHRADEFVIEKMVEVSAVLGARVQGDDGELYS